MSPRAIALLCGCLVLAVGALVAGFVVYGWFNHG